MIRHALPSAIGFQPDCLGLGIALENVFNSTQKAFEERSFEQIGTVLKSKEKLYKDVYESKEWLNEMVDKVGELIDRNRTVVRNLKSTELSVMK